MNEMINTFGQQFYPTPEIVLDKMFKLLRKTKKLYTVLEPSAGKGNILDALTKELKMLKYVWHDIDIDCIEIDENLQHLLKGKGYKVVHNDFLTYQTIKRYNVIIMNPPFAEGERHLLKALDMQQHGGKIICVLNAETIKNPYSILRKDLIAKLDRLGASIEYMQNAFMDAERKTDVEIALITY
jgi:16S rRNA G1207 methylase RsmC